MPINVFGNSSSSYDQGNKIDTSLLVKNPHLRTNCIEANIEEDIDLKSQLRIKNLPDPISIREAALKNYVDNDFNDPSTIKNTDHVDFNDKNLDNVHSIKVNSFPTLEEQLTAKIYVDQAISDSVDESSLLRLDPDEKLEERNFIVLNSSLTITKTVTKLPTKSYVDITLSDPSVVRNNAHVDFKDKNLDNIRFVKVNSLPAVPEHLTPKYYVDQVISCWLDELSLLRLDPNEQSNLDEQDILLLNSSLTSPKTIIEVPTKSYVDSLHEINRSRRDLFSVFKDQDNEVDKNKLNNLDSVTVDRISSSDNEVSNKKYIDDSIGEGTLLRFIQTLENYLKISVGGDTYNLTKYDKIEIVDTTVIKYPNTGGYFLQNWVLKCNVEKKW